MFFAFRMVAENRQTQQTARREEHIMNDSLQFDHAGYQNASVYRDKRRERR